MATEVNKAYTKREVYPQSEEFTFVVDAFMELVGTLHEEAESAAALFHFEVTHRHLVFAELTSRKSELDANKYADLLSLLGAFITELHPVFRGSLATHFYTDDSLTVRQCVEGACERIYDNYGQFHTERFERMLTQTVSVVCESCFENGLLDGLDFLVRFLFCFTV